MMTRALKTMSWVMLTLGAVWAFLAILFVFDKDQEDGKAILGGAFMAVAFALPGGILMWRLRRSEREQTFRRQCVGFLRTRDRFTVQELATWIGRTPLEADALIRELVEELKDLELLYHRATGEYVHRSRIGAQERVVDRCSACGAKFHSELVLEHEPIACQYCASPL